MVDAKALKDGNRCRPIPYGSNLQATHSGGCSWLVRCRRPRSSCRSAAGSVVIVIVVVVVVCCCLSTSSSSSSASSSSFSCLPCLTLRPSVRPLAFFRAILLLHPLSPSNSRWMTTMPPPWPSRRDQSESMSLAPGGGASASGALGSQSQLGTVTVSKLKRELEAAERAKEQ